MGGLPFFASLFSLCYFSLLNFIFLFSLVDSRGLYNFAWFFAGCLLGVWLIQIIVRGHISVLLHEWKHAIMSNLAGNKFKSFQIREKTGHHEYEYTKSTAKYNAIIALAPYFFPLFTIVAVLLALALVHSSLSLAILILGACYGADAILNIRDIGEHQSDFTDIRGGYYVGLSFVIAMNLSLFTLLSAWILQQNTGIKLLLLKHFDFFKALLGL